MQFGYLTYLVGMFISHSMQNSSSQVGIPDTDNIGKETYPSLVLVIATALTPNVSTLTSLQADKVGG